MDEEHAVLGAIMSAAEARTLLARGTEWPGAATYMLWNRAELRPIYCGTAKSPSRLRSHLDKDDLANRPVGKTHVNPGLRAYCLSQPAGWLGVSFKMFDSFEAAQAMERTLITRFGIQKLGGRLFNQRISG